jgi:hypothetical protein
MPGYSPELNPDELLNKNTKQGTRRQRRCDQSHMMANARGHLRRRVCGLRFGCSRTRWFPRSTLFLNPQFPGTAHPSRSVADCIRPPRRPRLARDRLRLDVPRAYHGGR